MFALLLALVVGTWNGNWFPSGRAEHRAHPDVEAATISAAGQMLAEGLRRTDPTQQDDIILSLCEIRNREVAERLVAAIGRADLKVASVSGYRRRDRFDQQQNVILTTLPIADARWETWPRKTKGNPPRGYAYASLIVEPAVTAHVYSVHLKSNYGATTPEIADANRLKRTGAIESFVRLEKQQPFSILAGDFNADKWRKEFAEEAIFTLLDTAGYLNLLELLPPKNRGTHPNKRHGDSALDYVMVRGFEAEGEPFIQPNDQLSDHLALFARIKPSLPPQAPRGTSRASRRKP